MKHARKSVRCHAITREREIPVIVKLKVNREAHIFSALS